MSRFEQICEQTEFLLQQQQKAKKECSALFADLLAFVEAKIKDYEQGSTEHQSLEKTHDLVSSQAQKLIDETSEDIGFLEEQFDALKEIKATGDTEAIKDLLASFVDDEEEVLPTEDFKAQILEETASAKKTLIGMIDDIKEALNEGSFRDVQLLLESLMEDEDDEMEDEDDACCGKGCGSGACGDCPSKCGSESTDLFGDYDRDLEDDQEDDFGASKKKKGHK